MKKTPFLFIPLLCLLFSFKQNSTCPATGSASGEKLKALCALKNRSTAPQNQEIDRGISLESLLKSKDDKQIFDEKRATVVTGYVYDVVQAKPDSCNCNSKNAADLTILVYLAKDLKARSNADCAVAAVTPASRQISPSLTLKYLKSIQGKRVKITGWLLYDYTQLKASGDTHSNGLGLLMQTVWQLYPVTAVMVDE